MVFKNRPEVLSLLAIVLALASIGYAKGIVGYQVWTTDEGYSFGFQVMLPELYLFSVALLVHAVHSLLQINAASHQVNSALYINWHPLQCSLLVLVSLSTDSGTGKPTIR